MGNRNSGIPYATSDYSTFEENGTINDSYSYDYIEGIQGPNQNLYLMTGIFAYLVCFIGLLANTWVIFVIVRRLGLTTAGNMYILMLAIADDLFLCSLIFTAASVITFSWPFGEVLCYLVFAIDGLNMYASAFFVTAMSIERYLAVKGSSRARIHRKRRKTILVSAVIWIASFLAATPSMIMTTYFSHPTQGISCTLNMAYLSGGDGDDPDSHTLGARIFITYNFTLNFIFPLTVTSLCYGRLINQMREVSMRHASGASADLGRVARVVTGVVVVFFICWSPFYISRMVMAYFLQSNNWSGMAYVFEITLCFSYANSCINPIVYALVNDKFRENLPNLPWRTNNGYTKGQKKNQRMTSIRSTAQTDLNCRSGVFNNNHNHNHNDTHEKAVHQNSGTT